MKDYSLVGIDGNAFSVLGYVKNALRKEQKSQKEIDEYMEIATAGTYSQLLIYSMDMIDRLNDEKGVVNYEEDEDSGDNVDGDDYGEEFSEYDDDDEDDDEEYMGDNQLHREWGSDDDGNDVNNDNDNSSGINRGEID